MIPNQTDQATTYIVAPHIGVYGAIVNAYRITGACVCVPTVAAAARVALRDKDQYGISRAVIVTEAGVWRAGEDGE
jgi:hypothetical protein